MTNEQHTSRPDITLDWADVEAWVKTHDKKLKPYQNSYGGYNIDCPIPTHQLKDQRLSIRPMKDGNVFLKCFGGCNYQDVRAAIAKEIKPPFVNKPHIEALEEAVAATEGEHDRERAARSAADDQARQEAHKRAAVESRNRKLQEEKSSLENRLTAAKAKVSQVETQLGVRIRVILLEERIKELAAGQGKSIQHEIRVRELQKDSEDTKARIKELEEQHAADEDRIKNLQGGAARTRLKERTANEGRIKKLEQELTDARDQENQHAQKLDDRDSRIKELEKGMAESKRKVLTFDFLETWCSLEKKLKSLNRELIQDGQRTVVANQLRRAHEKGSINDQQLMNLDNMRAQRDDVVHNALLLTTSQARAHLGILKQVIGQL